MWLAVMNIDAKDAFTSVCMMAGVWGYVVLCFTCVQGVDGCGQVRE
jgi:hypothetical protein